VLVVAALGVVYGDIGTSPLYALRECFSGPHGVAPSAPNVLGVLSLITWALILVVSIKYLLLIVRADNQGEGGILALLALAAPEPVAPRGSSRLVLLGLFGAALLYGDGMITPAISVLSAVEGLKIATPVFEPYVIPLTIAVLIGLFALQRRGTGAVGAVFGPITLGWFGCLGALGVASIVRTPAITTALNPAHAIRFFADNGAAAFVVLGAVFLVVTGAEALYADLGHFGRRPIRWAWFTVALPALLLNYFGQGALLLREPEHAVNPFYHLAPPWALYPLVALATAATVIASQALISGAFSLTWQAVQLGFLPRIHVQHTSEDEIGQVYIPRVNQALLIATVALVLGFGTSSHLAGAYGVAVTATMVITTLLAFAVMRRVWGWSLAVAGALTLVFLVVDGAFLASNLLKIAHGGWFPLVVGAGILTLMTTWHTGRRLVAERIQERAMSLEDLRARIETDRVVRVPGSAVYLARRSDQVPPALPRLLRLFNAVHEQVLFFTVVAERVPRVERDQRLDVQPLGQGFYRATARYGFFEQPNVPRALGRCREQGLVVDPNVAIYVVSPETVIPSPRRGMAPWRERLFAFMARNADRATEFYRIPASRVLEIGAQIEL
jgi:KUP system potassium uptake protein